MNPRAARGPADVDAVAHVFVASLAATCVVGGADGHHLQRVRRLASGEVVTAADGTGRWRVYEVADVGAGQLTLAARGDVQPASESGTDLALAVALTKHGLDDVVAGLTELGVTRVTPVRTARVVVRWDAARAARAVARLGVVAREAAMQSRRARIPQIDDVVDLPDLVQRPGLVVADRVGLAAAELPPPPAAGWTVLVGPEGGLTAEELAALGDAPRLRLGSHVLRAATAPIAAAAVLGAAVGPLRPE